MLMKYRSFVVVNDLINFGKYGINAMLLWCRDCNAVNSTTAKGRFGIFGLLMLPKKNLMEYRLIEKLVLK